MSLNIKRGKRVAFIGAVMLSGAAVCFVILAALTASGVVRKIVEIRRRRAYILRP